MALCERARRVWVGGRGSPCFALKFSKIALSGPLPNPRHRGGPEVGGEAILHICFDAIPNMALVRRYFLFFIFIFMPYIFVSGGEEEIAELGV